MKKVSPNIAIIINSYNRVDLLKECLTVLSSWVGQSSFKSRMVAVVFDAGSTDGSLAWLHDNIPNLGLQVDVLNPKPSDDTSFSAGLNAGVNHALKKFDSVRYLLFYETDNQILGPAPLDHALAKLKEREKLAACGFTVRKHDGRPAGVGMPFPSLLNFALGRKIVSYFDLEAVAYRWEKDKEGVEFSELAVVFTSPLLVKVEAWLESQGLDANTFPFSDCDVDWAHRLQKLGWKMGVVRTNTVIHDNRESLSAWSKSRDKQFHRGRLRYLMRHRPNAFYAVWPVPLLLRHLAEYVTAKLLIRDRARRSHLSKQFSGLLLSCLRKYA